MIYRILQVFLLYWSEKLHLNANEDKRYANRSVLALFMKVYYNVVCEYLHTLFILILIFFPFDSQNDGLLVCLRVYVLMRTGDVIMNSALCNGTEVLAGARVGRGGRMLLYTFSVYSIIIIIIIPIYFTGGLIRAFYPECNGRQDLLLGWGKGSYLLLLFLWSSCLSLTMVDSIENSRKMVLVEGCNY